MSDLLSKGLGAKNSNSTEGAGKKSEPTSTQSSSSNGQYMDRGEDLISAGVKKTASVNNAANAEVTSGAESGSTPKSASSMEEPTGGQKTNAEDWTTESALKEIKKLREENKQYRLKYAEQVDKLKIESDAAIKQKEAEMQALAEAKLELDKLKADQEDKKRDLSEKLAHREARLSEMSAIFESREKEYKKNLSSMEARIKAFEAEQEAQMQVYKARLDEELANIPQKFKDIATLIVKGAGDQRDALIALAEARTNGVFEDKTIVVNHSVPNAADGARSGKDRLEEAEKARRSKLTGQQKIGEAIKGIRSGQPNSAYRPK